MSRRDPSILLEDMLAAMDKISRYTDGWSRDQFLADERTTDAVVRNIEIIGEAVRQLPEPFKQAHSEISWRQIAGMRNRIVHDYFGVDVEIIWQVITTNLPELKRQVIYVLDSEEK